MSKCYLFMAGGTGGHIFPAMAVAKELMQRGAQIHWLGTPLGMEASIVPEQNIALHTLSVKGFRGKSLFKKILAPFLLVKAIAQAMSVIKKVNPEVVVGFGGFVAAPGGIAARLMGKPLLIHEQNSVAGSTNTLLARLAHKILEAFPGSLPDAIHVGNPVRQTIVDLNKKQVSDSLTDSLRLLIIGGSLGAKAINDVLPATIDQLGDNQPAIWHQTGKDKKQAVVDGYKQFNIDARIDEFIEDMADAYRWADVLICRSGALTVSEVAVAGVPAIFIPLPSSIDNHQFYNAKWLVDNDAALMIEQKNLTANVLAEMLENLTKNKEQLSVMGAKVKKLGLPRAVNEVADYCEELSDVV